ncbi:helix-turn-helix domain-containing protein [Sphingomonas sp. DC1600-2]|uniref:helix-turn-helix domain-containing protein n=1 Tax=unclassified Sphingomonas TaxID=196159 RepID=UPI003CEC7975
MKPVTISIKETTEALGIGRTTAYQLIRDGRLEVIKLGRRTLVKADSLRRLVDAE